jgi:ABC-type polysaccharide/polyol phosphate transport system ATPase subunit
MEKEIAVKIEHVSKTFRIPHEKVSSVRGAVVNMFRQSTYEEFQALDDVSFEVKKGEFFGIIGRNGSGKSTLLKVLAGIYQPDAGKVAIDGMISPFLELGIGFNPELSGRDNVYLNATVLGMTKKEIDQKFNDIVAFSELERFIDQKLKNYSSGMQVRLAFAVSIHANRDILLMDEVLAVGDGNFQAKCLNEFLQYKKMGKTVILVTHDISVVQRYCDRAVLLKNGKIEAQGNVHQVVNEYYKQNREDQNAQKKAPAKKAAGGEKDERPYEENVVSIDSLKVISAENGTEETLQVGEKVKVQVRHTFLKQVTNPIFGIIVRNSAGQQIFATNTLMQQINTGVFEPGVACVEYVFNSYFAAGTYTITPAVAHESATVFYDWQEEMKSFSVQSLYTSGGIIEMKHEINIKK